MSKAKNVNVDYTGGKLYLTKTCPCEYTDFILVVMMKIFIGKILIFLI